MTHKNPEAMKNTLLAIILILASAAAAGAQEIDATSENYLPPDSTLPDYGKRERVGLVLSGGGAKGIAHVGVIKALEDNEIPIDYVTGTSMGAIVGSFYSCGWSPEKMMELFTSQDFIDWSTGTINKDHIYYYYQPSPTSKWLEVNVSFRNKKKESLPTQLIPTSLVSPLPMNIEFLKLFGPYTEQCGENFNRLFVPFRCVASDVYHKHKVVFGEGSLGDAVRASMSFPMVFRPIEVNGVLLYDGGIYDNFPVNVMHKDFDPDFIIGVSVSGADTKPTRGDMYSQLEDMIIQNNDYSLPADLGVKIQVPVLNYGVLQFDKAKTIYEIGYQTGLSMVDSIKKRISARVPLEEVTARRDSFARHTPKLIFDSVQVSGLNRSQSYYLRYLFTKDRKTPITMGEAESAYYRAVTDGSLSNLVPRAEFEPDGMNILKLYATPRRPWSASVGGWVTTSTSSMLYVSAGYHSMSHNSLSVNLSGWVGQSYYAGMLSAKFAMRTNIPSYIRVDGVMSQQKYYDSDVLFFKSSNPMFITEIDNFLRVHYIWAIGRKMRGYMSLAGGYISDTYYPGSGMEYKDADRDKLQNKVGIFRLGIDASSLNNAMYPSAGSKWFANVDLSLQSSRFRPEGRKTGDGYDTRTIAAIELYWNKYFKPARHWSIGVMANGVGTLQRLNENYTNTLIHSPAFAPTPSTKNYFNVSFRSDNYLAAGVIPIWLPYSRLQVRSEFYVYSPVRDLRDNGRFKNASWGGWFRKAEFLGEVSVIYNFPFASVSLYGNYLSSPSRNWNFGLSFGLFFQAPRLLRR